MIYGIGCDLLYIDRVLNLIRYDNFLNKYFTENERDLFERVKGNHSIYIKKIASNLCVKEAFFKAVSDSIGFFRFQDIEILRDNSGKPYINLYNGLSFIRNKFAVHLTISNERNIVTSFVVLEKII